MKKLKYLIDITEKQKAGLFYSVLERIARNSEDKTIYNLSFYDGLTVSFFKKIFKSKPKVKKDVILYKNIKIEPIHIKRNLFHYLLVYMGCSSFVRKLDAIKIIKEKKIKDTDVVYTHWAVSAGLIGHYLKRMTRCKLIICCHGSDIHTIPLQRKDIRKSLLNALEIADRNIFVSKALLKAAYSLGYKNKNHCVIYNGVEDKYGENIKEQQIEQFSTKYGLSFNNSQVKIGFIGNLKVIKGADFLPIITQRVATATDKCNFIIAGDGELKNKIQYNCTNTTFIGHIDRDEVAILLNMIDILILPSRNEGLPLIIAEAKKCGVLVVAAEVGGVNEILEQQYCIPFDDDFLDNFSCRIIAAVNEEQSTYPLKDCFIWEEIMKQETKVLNDVRCKI